MKVIAIKETTMPKKETAPVMVRIEKEIIDWVDEQAQLARTNRSTLLRQIIGAAYDRRKKV